MSFHQEFFLCFDVINIKYTRFRLFVKHEENMELEQNVKLLHASRIYKKFIGNKKMTRLEKLAYSTQKNPMSTSSTQGHQKK